MNLREARINNDLESFIKRRESLDAPNKDAVMNYIDASAIPLENHKASQSKFSEGSDDDCK